MIVYYIIYGKPVCRFCAVISPPSVASQALLGQQVKDPMLLLLYVILFEPVIQFSTIFPDGCHCPNCHSKAELMHWNNGISSAHTPRNLHDIDHMVLLVSATYRCSNGHEIRSTDPRIIQLFDEQELIPFNPLPTGMTRTFARNIIRLVLEGMTFSSIERFIATRRAEYVASLSLQMHSVLITKYGST